MKQTCRSVRTLQVGVLVMTIFLHFSQSAVRAEERNATSLYKLSPSQQRYVTTNGYPEQFILFFASNELPSKKVLSQLRRLEAWLYPTKERFVIFDNGYFVEEKPTEVVIEDPETIPRTILKPTQFSPFLTPYEAIRLFGKPDKVETARLGKHAFEVYRYLIPNRGAGVLSITFFDRQLVCVMAGLTIQPADLPSLQEEVKRGLP